MKLHWFQTEVKERVLAKLPICNAYLCNA